MRPDLLKISREERITGQKILNKELASAQNLVRHMYNESGTKTTSSKWRKSEQNQPAWLEERVMI